MDKTIPRRPTFKSQPTVAARAMREQLKPEVEWTEDSSNRVLLMHLPGFKREELRVQLTNTGKILIKGSRQVPDNKYIDVDQSFDVPKDTIVEKISGRFEDGRLTLIMPKKVVEEQEAIRKTISEEKAEEPVPEEEMPYGTKEKKDSEAIAEKKEPVKKEEPVKRHETKSEEKQRSDFKTDEEIVKEKEKTKGEKMEEGEWKKEEPKKDEPMPTEKPKALAEKPESSDGKKDEAITKEKVKVDGEKMEKGEWKKEEPKKDEPMREDKPIATEAKKRSSEDTKVEAVEDEETKPKEEKKDEPFENEKLDSVEKKFEEYHETEKAMSTEMEKTILRMKSKIKEICIDKPKDRTKMISARRGGEDSWLDSQSLNGFLETLNRNRKIIAVAVAAFSAGVYASQKLRSSGK